MSDVPAAGTAAEPTNTPAAEPAAAAPPAISETAAPAAAETAAPPAAETAPAIDAESRAPSLLSGEAATAGADAEAAKPADGAASSDAGKLAAEEKPAGETTEAAAAVEPLAYEKFSVPEGMRLDDDRVGALTELIAPLRVPQEKAQALVDLHIAEMQRHDDEMRRDQHRVFAETRQGWVREFENDPEIGGNRRDTTLANANWAIRELAGDAAQLAELRQALILTGAGDHPALIRLMNNAAVRLRERGAPPPALPPKPGGGGRPEDRRYPEMS